MVGEFRDCLCSTVHFATAKEPETREKRVDAAGVGG